MFKKNLLASAVAVAAFASFGANAALTQTATKVKYATELFGSGSSAVELKGTSTAIVTTNADVDASVGEFTFTLTNGTFGDTVILGDLVFADNGAGAGTATTKLLSGGAIGDSAVTFEVTAGAGGGKWTSTDALTLTVNNIKGANSLSDDTKKVEIVTTIKVTASGTTTFPGTITVTSKDLAESGAGLTTFKVDDGAVTGSNNEIDIDKRETLKNGYAVLADAGVVLAGAGVNDNEGNTFAFNAKDKLNFKVVGAYNAGDKVCLAADATKLCAAAGDTAFAIAGGTASLTEAADPATSNGKSVVYVPAGTLALAPATFNTTLDVTWNTATNVAKSDTATLATTFSGINTGAKAMVVTPKGSADETYIRVTNESGAETTVFAQMYAQDGTDLGFKELAKIAAKATTVYSSADLEAVFGAWTGRSNLTFSTSAATANVKVVSLIRASNVLTEVGNRN